MNIWPGFMLKTTLAKYLQVCPATITNELLLGRLPEPITLGGRDHWSKEEVDAMLRRRVAGVVEEDFEADFAARLARERAA